jgi:outer membrane receptor for ferrienterochelin and colicins
MRQILFQIIVLLHFPLFGQSSGSIAGIVKSAGEPIPGATIKIVGTEHGAVTDANGFYSFPGLSLKPYKLEVRSVGFKPLIFQLDLSENLNQIFNPILQESVLNMNEVVVTGTMQPTFVTQSPIKVEVMTSKHVNTYMPAAASGIVESISLISGVQEVVACGVCFTNSISINGLPGPYTAILMDGTPIYGNLASVYGLNGIPSMIIDRFEVIKGPSSTLYGSEAVAGVINIITKNPETQPLFSMDVMGTSHLESFGNFAIAPKLKKASGFVGLNYAYINDFDDINDDGFSDMASLDRISVFTKWNIKRKSMEPFSIAAKYYYEDRRNGVEEFLKDRNYRELRGDSEIYGESIYTNRAEIFGTYAFAMNEKLKLDYSFSSHFQDSYYGSSHYKADQNIVFTNLIWEKSLKTQNLLAGFTSRFQTYDDNTIATQVTSGITVRNKPDNQYIPGLFVQDEWNIGQTFTLLGGVRADHYQSHGMIISPRINSKFKLGQWTTLRSNFGTGFRIVNLFTEDHAFLSSQREVMIVEELEPERSYNFSLNANHIFTMGSSQGSFDFDAFYTYFTNKIIPNYDDPSLIVYENTNGYAVTKGVSMSVSQEFEFPLAMNIGFNAQDVTETELNQLGENEKRKIEFAPNWTGVFTANYQLKKIGLTIAYTLNVTGPMALPEVYDLDVNGESITVSRPTTSTAFAIQNIQLNQKINGNFSCYFGVQNLLNYTQKYSPLVGYNDPNANPGFSSSFDTSYAYAPIHGREFYLGLNFSIN